MKRALAAGYEWLEIHSACGYLIHEFLSPPSNQRTDRYGGTFENRTRFLIETTRAVRGVWPERLPLGVRISCCDWMDGGWDLEQSVALARLLKSEGVDLIDCSSGGLVPKATIPVGPGFEVPFAEHIHRSVPRADHLVRRDPRRRVLQNLEQRLLIDLSLRVCQWLLTHLLESDRRFAQVYFELCGSTSPSAGPD
jgi:2,4-dienoyl-CoA reductase-like NADH-dependent reductase (Old Yellow Enzyme family)